MSSTLDTPRTILRPFVEADAETAFRWFGDTEVMRFTPAGPDRSIQDTRVRLLGYVNHQQEHGFSKWLVTLRDTGEAVGDSGPLRDSVPGEVELGFRLTRACWGRGLATEIAAAWLHTLFRHFDTQRVVAFAHPDNVASIRVMQKVGFRFLRNDTIHGMVTVVYGVDKS